MNYFIILALAWLIGGCTLGPQKSGIEIMSYPMAKVYLDGKEAGMSPYKNNNLKPGEVEVKLVAGDGSEWKKTVRLENYSDTVIEREFGESSSGYMLSLEKNGGENSGLLINATPDTSAISIDGEIKGFSPLRIEDIGSGDKQIQISFPTYKTRTLFVKGISGYQLVVEVDLALEPSSNTTATPTPQEQSSDIIKIMIKPTDTGWLRVREEASLTSVELMKAKPGETYDLLSESDGWYQIKINQDLVGWISADYADKL